MELKQADRFLFKALYFSVAGVVVFQTLDVSRLTSILFTLTFPLTVLLWLRSVREKVSMLDILTLLTSVATIIFVLIDAMIQNACQSVLSFKLEALAQGAQKIHLFATSATRDAANQDAFVSALERVTGLELDICSGDKFDESSF